MKYTKCPKCGKTIAKRENGTCIYCGCKIDEAEQDNNTSVLLPMPKPPSYKKFYNSQAISILVTILGLIGFFITFFFSTNIDTSTDTVIQGNGNLATVRWILLIISVVSSFSLLTSKQEYDNENKQYRIRCNEINKLNQQIYLKKTKENPNAFSEKDKRDYKLNKFDNNEL